MAIEFYGMPMQPSSVGLDTLFNLMEQGSAGGELILLDSELSSVIYNLAELQSEEYAALAEAAKESFKIREPQEGKCASLLAFMVNCVVEGVKAVYEFGFTVLEEAVNFSAKTLNKIVGATSSGLGELFKGEGGIMIIIAIVIIAMIFLK